MDEKKHRIKIEDIVDRLIQYCETNPKEWNNPKKANRKFSQIEDEKIRQQEIEKLKRARNDYKYICTRLSKGKLKKEYEERLQAAGVGRRFGVAPEIIEYSKRYGIDEKILKSIVKDFGSLDKFREKYIEFFINGGKGEDDTLIKKYIKKLDGHLIDKLDISSPDYICRDNQYPELYAIWKFQIINFNELKKCTEEFIKSIESPRNAQIFKVYFGIEGNEKQSLRTIANHLHLSFQGIEEIIQRILKKYNKKVDSSVSKVQDPEKREQIIRLFFDSHEIFYDDKVAETNLDTKNEEKRKITEEMSKIYLRINLIEKNIKKAMGETDGINLNGKFNKELEIQKELLKRIGKIKAGKGLLKSDGNMPEINQLIEELNLSYLQAEVADIEEKAKPIEKINFTNEITRLLKRAGINLVANLVSKQPEELLVIKGMGKKHYEIILEKIQQMGYMPNGESDRLEQQLTKIIEILRERYNELEEEIQKIEKVKKDISNKIRAIQTKKISPKERKERIETLLGDRDYFKNFGALDDLEELRKEVAEEISHHEEQEKPLKEELEKQNAEQAKKKEEQREIKRQIDDLLH